MVSHKTNTAPGKGLGLSPPLASMSYYIYFRTTCIYHNAYNAQYKAFFKYIKPGQNCNM